jgi:hypothetical protein
MKARKTNMQGRNRLTPVPEPEETTEAQVFEMPVASGNEGAAFAYGSFSGLDPEPLATLEDTRASAVIALGLAALSGAAMALAIVGIVLALT